MRAHFIAAVTLMFAGVASAQCVGSKTNYSCYDANSGNSYQVNRIGNSSYMNGYNASTGSTWTQNSQTYGNTTRINGTASNGSAWNESVTNNGASRTISGTDSRGNYYFKTCTAAGCF